MTAEERNSKRYRQLQQELEDFTYIVSHDLSAPVRHVEQFSALLAKRLSDRDVLNTEEQQFLDIMTSSAHRARAMIDALHKLSRLNTTELKYVPIELSKLLEKTRTELSQRMQDHRFSLLFDDKLPDIEADRSSFRVALNALIDNAIRFAASDKPTEITILSRINGDNIEIDIKDNGQGIETKLAERVFQCFFQENPNKDDFIHLGVGLTAARRILRRHNGDITIECGSSSHGWPRITLPLKQPSV